MSEGKIPDAFRIYAMLNVAQRHVGYFRHSHTVALSREGPVPPVTVETPKNIQTVSFAVGRCFFHINADRIEGFRIEDRVNVVPVWDTSRFWPIQRPIRNWPHRPALNEDGIMFVMNCLQRYIDASNTVWV